MELEVKEGSDRWFRVFEHKGRDVTIGAIVSNDNELLIGHSICNPEDEFDEALAAKIITGRALKQSSRLMSFDLKEEHQSDEVIRFLLDLSTDQIIKNIEDYLPAFSALRDVKDKAIEVGDWVVVLPEDRYYRNAEQGVAQEVIKVWSGDVFRTYLLEFSNKTLNCFKKVRKATKKEIAHAKSLRPF